MANPLQQARKALFLENNAQLALDCLEPLLADADSLDFADRRGVLELAGLSLSRLGYYDQATQYFSATGDYYQAGYCQMLKGDINGTLQYWRPLSTLRQNHWCISLYGLIMNRMSSVPTFLQVRNHLEADIIHLAQAGQTQWVDHIVNHADTLGQINYEAYKFTGRALYHIGRYEKAGQMLLLGQRILPNDPEVYFHLGQYYHAIGQPQDATTAIKQCLLITPEYIPALDLLAKIQTH